MKLHKAINIIFLYFCIVCIVHGQDAEKCSQTCHPNGECKEYQNGDNLEYCCTCKEGYQGNGVNCMIQDGAVTLRGNVEGSINDVELKDQEVHAYVDTTTMDGRSYVALGSVPVEIGKSIELAINFATPIYWLFATSELDYSSSLNGFKLTGGVLNRVCEATFYDSNERIIGNLNIQQTFSGFNGGSEEIRLHTKINGRLPKLDYHEQVIYPDFQQRYYYVNNLNGDAQNNRVVKSDGSIRYRIMSHKNPSADADYKIMYTERIDFNRCDSADSVDTSGDIAVTPKRLIVTYTQGNGQVRFSSANFLLPANKTNDPCEKNNCNIFSECVADDGSENGYYCTCKPGFEGDGIECKDHNECDSGITSCSPHATCINLFGYYDCACNSPYHGDGRYCELENKTPELEICTKCDANADCVTLDSKYACKCKSGYYGNGLECVKEAVVQPEEPVEPVEPEEPVKTSTPKTVTKESFNGLEHTDACENCHLFASCERQKDGGECCRCLDGYVGNGKYCFADASQIMITGKINGVVNGENLNDMDFFASILTLALDSRNHVALGNIPTSIAASMQILLSIVTPINWLFAGPQKYSNELNNNPIVQNGFTLTGGLFKRTCNLTFYDENFNPAYNLTIYQEFQGLDIEEADKSNRINVKTELHGTIPPVDPNAKIHYRDFKQQYKHVSHGVVQSLGEQDYEITYLDNTLEYTSYKFAYADEILFSECPHVPDPNGQLAKLNSKGVYIIHVKGDNLVRFSSVNFIYGQDDQDDPCRLNDCSIYAECTPDGNNEKGYECSCRIGYDGDGITCYDIDECANGEAACDENAICYNLLGHYECRCKSPYKGSGTQCHYDLSCKMCSLNAQCIEDNDGIRCICNDGWKGDGFQCTPIAVQPGNCGCNRNAECIPNYGLRKYECRCKNGFEGDGYICTPVPCNEVYNCDQNANCALNSNNRYECTCNSGFFGDGFECSTKTCDVLANCGDNARCVQDSVDQIFRCKCLSGFSGNGYQCTRDAQQCNIARNCHPNAECLLDDFRSRYFCKCKPGFNGDGYKCISRNSCRDNQNLCDVNAYCVYDNTLTDFICKCKNGFEGDGLYRSCHPIGEGPAGLHLVYAQGVSLHKVGFRFDERDNVQPYRNRLVYIPHQTAVAVAFDCHEQYIYWSDVSTKVINRIRPDGSNFALVLEGLQSPEGIAIDWISRNLYFTDSLSKTIEVLSLGAGHRKVLIKNNLHNPRGIAVDPIDGYIFWTDWYRKAPKIERANMDGSQRTVIVSENIGIPNGLYYDHRRLEVCWGDAKLKRIECVNRDGSGRRNVTHIEPMHLFDIAEIGSNIYWSDWTRKNIQTVSKSGVLGEPIKLAPGGNGRVYGIAIIKNSCPSAINRCAFTNGGCRYICVPQNDGGNKCLCPDNVEECTNRYAL